MRIRFFKHRTNGARFAWLPKRMSNGTWVWLEPYCRIPHGHGHHRESAR